MTAALTNSVFSPTHWRVGSGSEAAHLGQLSFSWYYTFGMHFCETQQAVPNMDSTRIFVTFLWLYTMVITIGYSTNLTAFLLVRKAPDAIETIKDLYDSGLEVAAIGDIYKAGIASASDPYLRVSHAAPRHACRKALQNITGK